MSTAARYSKHIQVPAPHPGKAASTLPTAFFRILKPPGARSEGGRQGGKVAPATKTHTSPWCGKAQSWSRIPNKDTLSGQGGMWQLRTKCGRKKETLGHGPRAQGPRRSRKAPQSTSLPTARPLQGARSLQAARVYGVEPTTTTQRLQKQQCVA